MEREDEAFRVVIKKPHSLCRGLDLQSITSTFNFCSSSSSGILVPSAAAEVSSACSPPLPASDRKVALAMAANSSAKPSETRSSLVWTNEMCDVQKCSSFFWLYHSPSRSLSMVSSFLASSVLRLLRLGGWGGKKKKAQRTPKPLRKRGPLPL